MRLIRPWTSVETRGRPGPPISALPGPVPSPGRTVPADHGLRLNENQGAAPTRPVLRQRRPETPVGFLEVRTARTGAHRELMSECEILQDEVPLGGGHQLQGDEQNPHGETSVLRVGSGAQSATVLSPKVSPRPCIHWPDGIFVPHRPESPLSRPPRHQCRLGSRDDLRGTAGACSNSFRSHA